MPRRQTYHTKHRVLSSTMTNEQHARFVEVARRRGMKPTPFASKILLDFLNNADNFEDCTLAYGDEPETVAP